jgi:secreted Zn-dependent insulinase-like peptidase
MRYVSALSSGMHYYAPQDILRGPYIMDDYQTEELARVLERVRPDNAMVVFTDKSAETDRTSEHYQVPYSVQTLSGQQLAAWQGDEGADALALPAPNPFIAEDVALVPIARDNPEYPTMVVARDRQTVWFRQDDQFRVPKGAMYVNFRSPLVGQGPDQSAAAVLYTSLLKDSVNEFTYPALLAGMSFSFYKHAQGISLRISGYNDKQDALLQHLLEVMRDPDFEQDRFENIRRDMIRGLENAVAKRPTSQVIDDLRESLLYGEWGEAAMIEVLEQITLADVTQYADDFWNSATAESLLFGNYKPAEAAGLADALAPMLASAEAPELSDLKVLKLAPGENLQYAVDVPHDDSVVAWYLQAAGNSHSDRAATALAAQVTKSGFFQQLRTEQQLGYVVSSFAWPQLDVPGIVLLVQSPSHSAPEVVDAMQAFMMAVPADLDAEQFERHKAALVNEILRPDKNMWERAEFYWQSIAKKQFEFDDKQQLADAVTAFTMDDWLAYFERVFLNQRHSLQVVTPGRWDELPDMNARVLRSASEIKEGHDAYVIQ